MSTRLIDIRHFSFLPCNRKSAIEIRNFLWGHSSVGRAPALQAGSQGFESPCLHFIFDLRFAIADLNRCARARHQINRKSKIWREAAATGLKLSWLEHALDKRRVTGSSPVRPIFQKFAKARAPSPAREARALPSP